MVIWRKCKINLDIEQLVTLVLQWPTLCFREFFPYLLTQVNGSTFTLSQNDGDFFFIQIVVLKIVFLTEVHLKNEKIILQVRKKNLNPIF